MTTMYIVPVTWAALCGLMVFLGGLVATLDHYRVSWLKNSEGTAYLGTLSVWVGILAWVFWGMTYVGPIFHAYFPTHIENDMTLGDLIYIPVGLSICIAAVAALLGSFGIGECATRFVLAQTGQPRVRLATR